MNSTWKKVMIVGGCILLAGLVIMAAALAATGGELGRISFGPQSEEKLERVEKELTVSGSETVNIGTETFGITVTVSEDDKARLIYYVGEDRQFDFEQTDGEIKLHQQPTSIISMNGCVSFGFTQEVNSVQLSLPQDFGGELELLTDTGSIRIDGLSSISEAELTTYTGSVKIKGFGADKVDVNVGTGSVNAEDAVISGDLSIESTTGSISVSECEILGKLSCKATTGSVRLSELTAESIIAKATTGSISLKEIKSDAISAEATTGSVTGSIVGTESEYTISTDVGTGSCNLNDRTGSTDKTLTVSTGTGSISIRFSE